MFYGIVYTIPQLKTIKKRVRRNAQNGRIS